MTKGENNESRENGFMKMMKILHLKALARFLASRSSTEVYDVILRAAQEVLITWHLVSCMIISSRAPQKHSREMSHEKSVSAPLSLACHVEWLSRSLLCQALVWTFCVTMLAAPQSISRAFDKVFPFQLLQSEDRASVACGQKHVLRHVMKAPGSLPLSVINSSMHHRNLSHYLTTPPYLPLQIIATKPVKQSLIHPIENTQVLSSKSSNRAQLQSPLACSSAGRTARLCLSSHFISHLDLFHPPHRISELFPSPLQPPKASEFFRCVFLFPFPRFRPSR